MAFFGNKRKDFSIRLPRQQVDNTPFFVTDSANIDFTLENLNLTANLTTTGVTAGTYGSSILVPVITLDVYGRITGITTIAIGGGGTAAWGSIGAGTGVGSQTDLTTYLSTNYYPSSNPSGFITSSSLTPYLLSSVAASTYFPIPTGTVSEYIRGNGTLATFPTLGTWSTLNYPIWSSGTPFVKMTAAGIFALDTNTYLTDAPSDGTTYGRNNGAWAAVTGGGGITELTGDVTTPAASSGVTAATLKANLKIGSFGVTVDGVSSTIQVGQTGFVTLPYAGTITGWSITTNASGSIQFGVWKAAGAIPVLADSIVASAPPTLTTAQFVTSTTLTGWTTTFAAGDVFGFYVNSVSSTVKNATLTIRCTKS